MGNDRYALVQENAPLHYQDDAGAWQPIDPALTPVEGGWVDTRNTLRTSLAERTSSAKITNGAMGTGWEPIDMQLDRAGAQFSLATLLPEAQTAPGTRSADGRSVRYERSWSDTAIHDQWRVGAGNAEYSVRLMSLPGGRRTWGAGEHALDLRVQPRLSLTTDRLTFRAKRQPGGDPAAQTVTWSNIGGGTLALDATSSAPWLQATVSGDTVQVVVRGAALPVGFYSGVVRLTASGGAALANGPSCIRVNSWVAPADTDRSNGLATTIYLPVVMR